MATWRFYQGLRTEWRWYQFDNTGRVVAESDLGFAELHACMANAETAGFTAEAYQVHARQGGGAGSARRDDGEKSPNEITQGFKIPALRSTRP